MQVQKLVFFAHARLLAQHGEPLVTQGFEAWKWGPVVPALYHSLSGYGSSVVTGEIPSETPFLNLRVRDIINRVFERYGHLNGLELSKLTHFEGSPWSQVESSLREPISNESIEEYFAEEWRQEAEEILRRAQASPKIRAFIDDGFSQVERGEYEVITKDKLRERMSDLPSRS